MKRVPVIALISVLLGAMFAWGLWTGHSKAWPFDSLWHGWRAVRGVPMPFPAPQTLPSRVGLDEGLSTKADVVMLGDSITVMGRWNEYWPDLRVANRGLSGETVADVRKRIATVVAVDPQLVVLLIGTNDVAMRGDLTVAAAQFRQLVQSISARTRVLLVTVPPCVCALAQNDAINRFNIDVRRIGAEAKLPVIDLHAALVKGGSLDPAVTNDGTHLNAIGYSRWTRLVAPHLPVPRQRS